jgi:acyl-CoA synthetase (AMP-forming)/AMP-acid ligase II
VTILATAFALAQLLDGLGERGAHFVASGSTLMETGGFKGRRQELSRDELLRRVEDLLGIPESRVVREYGMTELTGHLYTGVLRGGHPDVFQVPPFMRVHLLDPESLQEVPPGEPGLVAIFDLANVGSALHVVSQDLGVATRGGFRLLGRAEGAELRGCSLTVEELSE